MKTADCPSYRYISLGEDMTKYKPENDDIATEPVKAFVQGVLDGKVRKLVQNSECNKLVSSSFVLCVLRCIMYGKFSRHLVIHEYKMFRMRAFTIVFSICFLGIYQSLNWIK